MKPVIKKQTHYNVLLMRDDSQARTFRVHSGFLHFCLILFLILMIGGGVGIFCGAKFFAKYRETAAANAAMEREISEMRLQLERLANLERLLTASTETGPKPSYTEVGGPVPGKSQNASTPAAPASAQVSAQATVAPASSALPASNVATAPPATGQTQQNATAQAPQNAAGQTPPASEAPTSAETPGDKGAGAAAETGSSPQTAAPNYPPLTSADSPLRIGDFNARLQGPQRLRISYELSTNLVDGQRPVSGQARYAAVLADGSRLDLPLQDMENTRFSILRMKPMQGVARLPQEIKPDEILRIDVIIEISEGRTYRETYPLRR
ncbi:MAG: hypothetical protein LBN33_07170 [Desulfovibrio sp.]|nr:hypothetical protein [Desulfovibrio sp.]